MTAEHDQRRDEVLSDLVDGARGLHTKTSVWNDRWLLVGGGAGFSIGFVLIILGWYGSAQTSLEFEQTPYLISGGILGLALVVAGGLIYFSYWLTCLVREGRAEAARTAAHQVRLEGLIAELLNRDTSKKARTPKLVMTATGTVLHRPECPATQGQAVMAAGPGRRDLPPCELCQPEVVA